MATRRLSGIATSSSVPDNGGDHSGGGGGAGGYVDNVFSTYLYEGSYDAANGTGQTQHIVNGIDLAGEGGMVWIKNREGSNPNTITDTERGVGKSLRSDATNAELDEPQALTSFTGDGFSVGNDASVNQGPWNGAPGKKIASWTFRKAPNFFDVVTYSGNGTSQTIPHNLGVAPGMVIVKGTDNSGSWVVYHQGLGGPNYFMYLNEAVGKYNNLQVWTADPTDSEFYVGSHSEVNGSGKQYVAYLFAHDDSDESMIKCGSYTGNGSNDGPEIDLGFEPQWVMIKSASGSHGWIMHDTMRGWTAEGKPIARLRADQAGAEYNDASYNEVAVTPTGFRMTDTHASTNQSGREFIYMAIRRPNKPAEEFEPEELFNTVPGRSDGKSPSYELGFPPDMAIQKAINGSADGHYIFSRPTGKALMFTNDNSAETTGSSVAWDYMDGVMDYFASSAYNAWGWRRAPGFFDVVTYEGDGQSGRELPHNLGVKPEMMWVKHRKDVTAGGDWVVYSEDLGAEHNLFLNENHSIKTNIEFNNTEPTDTHFTVSSQSRVNRSGAKYIAYLFASTPGISKVGSYTGTGAEIDVDCGFTTGARFVLIKRTDQVGDWYFWDTERGITTGNDPYLLLNTTDAQVTNTDYIDPLSSGFKVTASAPDAINASGGNYIFYSISS
jgi:hypothetical protein